MSHEKIMELVSSFERGEVSRRQFMQRTAVLGVSASAIGALLAGAVPGRGAAAAAQDELIELRLLTWVGAQNEPRYLAMLEDFEASHPNISISFESVPGTGAATYPDVLRTGIASGDPPDIFFMWGGSIAAPFIESGQVLPLDHFYEQYNWKERLIPWVVEDLTVDGTIYGVPMAARGMTFWYRTDIFEKYGLEVPETYAELEEVAAKLKEEGIAAISLGGQFGWNTMRLLDYFIEVTAGPEMHDQLNNLEASWDSPEVVEAYELLQKWTENGWITPGFMAVAPDDARIPFYQGEAAMVFEGDWLEGALKDNE
jgi:raffinose/stachyose/melibiose transport system substrate-binding protein